MSIEFGNYNYPSQIKTPSELGMGDEGTMGQLTRNVAGVINYINILVTGKSKASKEDKGPLGDAYFINTNSKCLNNGKPVPRHFYINNIPDGRIPFFSGKTNLKMKSFRGLIPGIIEDVSELNPEEMVKSFGKSDLPNCSLRTFKVVDSDGNVFKESRYVSDDEVKKTGTKELKDKNIKCNPNTQSNKGKSCCIVDEEEKRLYSPDDEILKCGTLKESFINKTFEDQHNPYTHFKNKKLNKFLKMFIIFTLLIGIIFFT